MAITSVGYDSAGFKYAEGDWAKAAPFFGAAEVVGGTNDLAVTTVSGQDRTLSVAAGVSHAYGVMATLTPAQTIQAPVVASGTRWDAICLRRDWTANDTTLVVVQGTSTQQLPAGLLNTPGTSHDQPLLLGQVTAGQQLHTGLIDLRVFAGKVWAAASLLALSRAPRGTEAVVNGTRYRRELVSGTVTTVRVAPRSQGGVLGPITFTAGEVSPPHGLPFTPTVFIVAPLVAVPNPIDVRVGSGPTPMNATNVALRAFNPATGAAYTGVVSAIHFWASE